MNKIFPNNVRGTQMNFVNEGESNKVLVCVEYHNRYEDSDCFGLFYNTETKRFFMDGWTTRAAADNNFFTEGVVDVNDASEALQQEIINEARKLAIIHQRDVRNRVSDYFRHKYPKSYSAKTRNEVLTKINLGIVEHINNTTELPVLVSFFHNDYDGYDTRSIFEKWADKMEKLTGISVKTEMKRTVKVSGDDFTGKVVAINKINAQYGKMLIIRLEIDEDKTVGGWLPSKGNDDITIGSTITINGTLSPDGSLQIWKCKRIDNVDPSLIVRINK